MQEDTRIPKSARDAFLIELIGDLGIISDSIKALPEDINQAVAGSLDLIAKSVEEAEKTASELTNSIKLQKAAVLDEFQQSVKNSLDSHAKETFSELEKTVNQLQNRINSFELADPKSRRLNIILSCTLAFTLALSGAAIYGIYSGAKSTIADLNMRIHSPDKSSSR